MTDTDQRQSLRREMRQRRRALSFEQQQQAAEQLCKRLSHQPLFLRSQRIAFYLPNDGEIDPMPLLHLAWQQGKQCYLPVLMPDGENSLCFIRYDKHTTLIQNRFGIAEPDTKNAEQILAQDLDLVLMPLVAFDASGNRMGMGGGFYDRTFAFKQHRPGHHPYLLGLAHSCQQVDQLHSEHWDIPLHGIATEAEFILSNTIHARRDFIDFGND